MSLPKNPAQHDGPPSCDGEPGVCPPPPALPPPPPYTPASSPASNGRSTFVTTLIIAGSALAFLVICLFVFLLVRHRRRQRQRRRREALLEAALAHAAPAAFPDGGGPGEDDVVHHAWHIRTVGLDEAAIESIALARHRAGAAADCAVCLGEFSDGELMRLLPKCAHAFHVPCIDTWLRAHVNCPLCRADVLDPAPAAAVQPAPRADEAGAGAEEAASSIGTAEREQPDQQANEQRVLRLQFHQSDQPSSPEHQRHHHHHHPVTRGRMFRRGASMDTPSPVAPAEEGPEDEQAGSEKQGSGAAICCEASPGSGHLDRPPVKRSLSAGSRWTIVSRHCSAHSSLLPM